MRLKLAEGDYCGRCVFWERGMLLATRSGCKLFTDFNPSTIDKRSKTCEQAFPDGIWLDIHGDIHGDNEK